MSRPGAVGAQPALPGVRRAAGARSRRGAGPRTQDAGPRGPASWGSRGWPARGRRGDQSLPSHLPSAAMPLALARSNTVFWAAAKLPTRSFDHSFSAALCIARP